jgi:hypothetical protein
MQPNFGHNLVDDDALLPESALQQGIIDKPQPVKPSDVLAKYTKRVWIMLTDSDQIPPTGQFIGHNGDGFMLRPNVPAHVPIELLDILNVAVWDAPIVDQITKQITGYTPRLRFPYQVVRAPAKEALPA